jgi:heat shock protein HtpX
MTNVFKTTLLLGLLMGVFLFFGQLLGGRTGLVIALVLAGVMNLVSYFFSDRIVLAMYRARPLAEADNPRLFAIVRNLSSRAGIPMPRLFLIPNESPNAFATGRDPAHAAVAVTEGITRLMSEDELAGVLAHELSHVKNRDILVASVAATIAGAVMMLADMARFAAIFGGGRDDDNGGGGILGALLMAVLAPIAALLIQMAISRSREYLADETGARLSGSPYPLASALEKLALASREIPMAANPATSHMFIVKPFSGRSLLQLFSTHPPAEKRIARLRAMARSPRT